METPEFITFVAEIKAMIQDAQYQALRSVNRYRIELYWSIGKLIIEKQQQYNWGKKVVESLSFALQMEYPGEPGYSSANLWRMRNFYLAYQASEILAPLVREIGWAHNLHIFEKCKDPLQREFYIRMTQKYGWTKNVLINHIENQTYEKYLLNQTNFDRTLPEKYRLQAKLAIKDEYTFGFLGLGNEHEEHELEQALIKNIRSFLIEMGGDFTFAGNQYVLEVDGKSFRVDLLLFHRRLQSLVAIDLKVGEFEPGYKGQMEFYLTALNERVKLPHENDSIGIIICKSKRKTIVEFALKSSLHPIGVATYSLTSSLPSDYIGLLPSEAEIIERLKFLGGDDQ
jgi:predicted nuclease of restriction endonuclease-like (RecB) superfamily